MRPSGDGKVHRYTGRDLSALKIERTDGRGRGGREPETERSGVVLFRNGDGENTSGAGRYAVRRRHRELQFAFGLDVGRKAAAYLPPFGVRDRQCEGHLLPVGRGLEGKRPATTRRG